MQAKGSDHRSRVTRMLIRKAFTELVGQKPIQSISVKELCALAGVNRSTFYAHYTDIFDLLQDMESELLEDFKKALEPLLAAEGDGLTPLKITTGIFRCLQDNADICAITLGPYGDKEFAAKIINIGWERYIEAYSTRFTGATHRELRFYYAFVSAGCIGLLEKWLADGMTTSVEELAAITEGIMMQGVGFLRKTRQDPAQ